MNLKDRVSLVLNLKSIGVEERKTTDVSPAYIRDDYSFIKKSHKTLLIFRRLLKKAGNQLELRH